MCYWFWTYGIMQVLLAIRSQGGEQALLQTMNRARELYAQRLQATPTFVRFTFPCIHSDWLAAPLVCPASLVFLHTGPKACLASLQPAPSDTIDFYVSPGARLMDTFGPGSWTLFASPEPGPLPQTSNQTSWNYVPRTWCGEPINPYIARLAGAASARPQLKESIPSLYAIRK